MRKIFGGAMAFSVVGAAVLGGTLAWESDQISGPQSVNVGALEWTLGYAQVTDALIGPNGTVVLLGHVALSNDGDFNLTIPDGDGLGEVIIESVVTETGANHAACDAYNFFGDVQNTSWDDELEPGEIESFAARVVMGVADDAPEACIGATVNYFVRVAVVTDGNGLPE
ncbi:MAG: hypothetical protein ACKVVT_11860 [Dehalococcoidia bacterium]